MLQVTPTFASDLETYLLYIILAIVPASKISFHRPYSVAVSCIIQGQPDKEMERSGLRFVRYADDFSIYCKNQKEVVCPADTKRNKDYFTSDLLQQTAVQVLQKKEQKDIQSPKGIVLNCRGLAQHELKHNWG